MKFKVLLILMTLVLIFTVSMNNYAADHKEYVIVIHGMTRSSNSMKKMAEFLSENGYCVILFDYVTRDNTIEQIAYDLKLHIDKLNIPDSIKINFVTHSMGAIVLRQYLNIYDLNNIGRVVMLSPPNNGSEVVDLFSKSRIAYYFIGPSFVQLKTDQNSFVKSLPLPDYEFGVITGKRLLNWFNSMIIPGPDDGKVTPESASLSNMKDFIIVSHTHPFIMNSKEVMQYTLNFIKNGTFKKSLELK